MQLINTNIIPSIEDSLWSLPKDLPVLENHKLLVLSSPFSAGSPEEATLLKMMTACKLNADEYVIIQLEPGEKLSWRLLAAAGAPDTILLLGTTPVQLGISASFLWNTGNNFLGCRFVPSAALAELEAGRELKRALWEHGLKPIFGSLS